MDMRQILILFQIVGILQVFADSTNVWVSKGKRTLR